MASLNNNGLNRVVTASKTALTRLLNLNAKASTFEPEWKILIYDRFGQDVISPLINAKDLRNLGVTVHMLLHSDRDTIPDVPAVYFVMPTAENIQRIAQDIENELYSAYYLNFISRISRQHLEDLASMAVRSNCIAHIKQVYDQYLNYISLEEDLFMLMYQSSESISYYAINRGEVKDTEMDEIVDKTVDGLFSVFVTLGTVPIIRSPRGNIAEMVAEKLDKKIRQTLLDSRTNNLFTSEIVHIGQHRPLLVILDRNLDLATPLHHTWTYQALAHDVLDLKLNFVTVAESDTQSGARKKPKGYDLNAADKFWMQYKGSPFPSVAESIQGELESYRSQEDQVKKLKSAMGLEGESDDTIDLLNDNTAKLTSAVSSLPELLEKKRLIDVHTTIATAVLDSIKNRKLDVYFELEEKILAKNTLDKSLMDVISDPEAGSNEDKMRLFLIYYMCGPPITDVELDQYSTALADQGCDLSPLNYVKRWKSYSNMTLSTNQYAVGGGGGAVKTVSMFSKLVSQGSQFVMEGVNNFVIKKHKLPVTRIVDSLMDLKSNPTTDDFQYYDPKMVKKLDSSKIPRVETPFQEAVVFVVGGGNYIEYQNLMDHFKSKVDGLGSKKIVYGCTNIHNASQFLKQLSKLGSEMH